MAINNDKNGMNRCPNCGGTDVSLDPKSGKLKCSFCRSLFDGKAANAAGGVDQLVGDKVGEGATAIIPSEDVILTLKCPACGAEVVINTDEVTSAKCHWCRHVLSVNEKMPNGAVPDLVLPFQMEKKMAETKIDEFVKKRQFFAHPIFKKEFSSENVKGVYLPYMVVDVNAHSKLDGEAEHQTRTYTVKTGNSTTRYYDADVYDVSREFDLLVDDLTIEASSDKLKQDVLVNTNNVISSIMPFDTENCVGWNPSYLRGYASEKRDTDIDILKPMVELQVKDIARYRAKESMKFYDRGAKWNSEILSVKGTSWKAAYLPVWLYSYLEVKGDKKLLHYVAVNARTGETMGSVPINKTRLIVISAIIEVIGAFLGIRWLLFWLGVDMDDNNPAFLGLAGLTPGFIFYWLMMNRYRNMSARHYHEKDTRSEVRDLKQFDKLRESRKHLRNSRIAGENDNLISGTVAQNGKKMLGEQMANYLGIGRSFGSSPNQMAAGQEPVKKKNKAGTIVLIIFIVLFLLIMFI